MASGPITTAITQLAAFFQNFVLKFAGGIGPATTKWLVDQSVYFQVIAVAVLLVKFFMDVVKENKGRKAEDRIIGLGSAMAFLGIRLAWIPAVVFATAIPGMFLRMTPSAFAATTSAAKKVGEVGDGLLNQAGTYWTMTVQGGAKQILGMSNDDGAKLTPDQRQAATDIQQRYGTSQTELFAAKQAYETALTSGGSPASIAQAKGRLTLAQNDFNSVNQALTNFARTVGPRLNGSAIEVEQAQKDLKVLESLKSQGVTLVPASTRVMPASHSGMPQTTTVDSAVADVQERIREATTPKSIGASDVPGILMDFIGSIGFYFCCLPALLGIIAGALIALKEALAVMQFGAKVDVMKGLGLTFAAFFAPVFMLGFLFQKTEQFAWKFVSFLFSVYFGVYGVSYACGVVANVGFSALSNTVTSLLAVPTGYLPKEASQALFFSSVTIGIMAVGIGLVTAFASDIVKSALQVGQGPFNGNFNA